MKLCKNGLDSLSELWPGPQDCTISFSGEVGDATAEIFDTFKSPRGWVFIVVGNTDNEIHCMRESTFESNSVFTSLHPALCKARRSSVSRARNGTNTSNLSAL